MLKKLAVALVATIMSIGMSVGSAQARISALSSFTHAHFPTCGEGLVSATCVCRAATRPGQQLCTAGRWCHTYDGACRQ
ncbi:MAG TPA: hypothetical protein VHU22_14785 [Xanthobacteraceae bacterium]|jgi:hypothetical protein|nr:hypothetical protein [Xanthobacteraceae bacterium]